MRRSKGVLPVPTTVIRPGTTAEPLKWVNQPRERRGSRCSSTAGKVEGPSVFMSMRRVRGVFGLASKTPLSFVAVAEEGVEAVLFAVVIWLGVFWRERIETMGSMYRDSKVLSFVNDFWLWPTKSWLPESQTSASTLVHPAARAS